MDKIGKRFLALYGAVAVSGWLIVAYRLIGFVIVGLFTYSLCSMDG